MATKLELHRLAADNATLREQGIALMHDIQMCSDRNRDLLNTITNLQTENSFLRERLNEADIRAKRLIAASNRRTGNPERRAAMERAREIARSTGQCVKV